MPKPARHRSLDHEKPQTQTATAGGHSVIAQGGSVAAGAGGVAVRGDVHGGIHMGPAPLPKPSAEEEIAALRAQLHTRQRLVMALEEQRLLAGAAESARLIVQIEQEQSQIARLQQQLDDLSQP